MKKMLMIGLTAAVMSQTALAADVTGYTAPVSGQPATAASVDANFQALITAIEDNNARIAALESYDVSGKAYNYRDIGFILSAQTSSASEHEASAAPRTQGFARIGIFTATMTITFDEVGTFSIVLDEQEVEMHVNPDSDIGPYAPASETITGTWTQVAGESVVSLLVDGEADPFDVMVSKGANTITSGDTLNLSDTSSQVIDGTTVYSYEYETTFGVGTLAP